MMPILALAPAPIVRFTASASTPHDNHKRSSWLPADHNETLYWNSLGRRARIPSLDSQIPYPARPRCCGMLWLRTRIPPVVGPFRAAGGILFRRNEGHKGMKPLL
jgi:hypothetical protein